MNKITLVILFLFINLAVQAADRKYLDSLEAAVKKDIPDTLKMKLLSDLCWEYGTIDRSKAISYGRKALELATELNNQPGIAQAQNDLGTIFVRSGDYEIALDHFYRSLEIRKRLNNNRAVASTLSKIAVVYEEKGDYSSSLKYGIEALSVFEKENDTMAMALQLGNIGQIYRHLPTPEKGFGYIKKAYELSIASGNQNLIASTTAMLMSEHESRKEYDKAITAGMKAYEIFIEIEDLAKAATAINNVGIMYTKMEKYKIAEEKIREGLALRKSIGDKRGITSSLNSLANVYINLKQYDLALDNLLAALKLSREIGSRDGEKGIYRDLAYVYHLKGNDGKAYDYMNKYINLKDSLFNEQTQEQLAEMELKYQSEKKQKQIELLEQETELKNLELNKNRIMIYSVSGGIILLVLLSGVMYNRYRLKKKSHELLRRQNDEIRQQKEIISDKNKDITDSINYARKIQQSILPDKANLDKHLPQSFIVYLPKDIISGDFYWFQEVNDNGRIKMIVAAADCTGHGVPGALMSMVGSAGLNHVVLEQKIYTPGDILNRLHMHVKNALKQDDETSSRDGMDIAICSIDPASATVEYAGANRNLVILSSNGLKEVKSTKTAVGGYHSAAQIEFTNHRMELLKGDRIYLYSDGYADQFGGEKGKKMMIKNFHSKIIDTSSLAMSEQGVAIHKHFLDWKGPHEQVDDILVLGIML